MTDEILDGQAAVTQHYRSLVLKHGAADSATQNSAEGQLFRYAKLFEIGDLDEQDVLDLGCGLGTMQPLLRARFPQARYTGIDIVPEMVEQAARRAPDARFLCRDVIREGLPQEFDTVLMSQMFNNARTDSERFLEQMLVTAFAGCRRALGFNFISTYVNHRDEGLDYHDPSAVLRLCTEKLSRKVTLQHHYGRCDVAVFVYR
jgi:SAM-dependent methyltransferase